MDDAARIEELEAELLRARAQNAALREQQAATADVLRVLATPDQELRTMLRVFQERARALVDATDGMIYRVDGDVMHRVPVPGVDPSDRAWGERPLNRLTIAGRAILDRRPHAVLDI